MKNTNYNIFRDSVTLGLPAISSLYFGLGEIWGLPGVESVTGTIALLTTFFGVVVRIMSRRYYNSDRPYDGEIVVSETEEGKQQFSLELGVDPSEIPNLSGVNFKVKPELTPPPFRGVVTPETPESDAGH